MELITRLRQDNLRKVRSAGKIPAVLYGHAVDSASLEVDYKDFDKIYKEAGENTIINLKFGDQSRNVLIYDIQRDSVTDKIIHIDFYQVRMDEVITVPIPLDFKGESPLIAEGGTLVKNIYEIEVEALPKDLPHELEIDISSLQTYDDKICVKDLTAPKGVKILAGAEEIIALITPPITEEELAALEEKPEEKVEEVEVIKPEKAEKEEIAEE